MGWWRNSDGLILGDGPADRLDDALQAIRSRPEGLSLDIVLAGIGNLLRSNPGVYAADSGADFRLVGTSAGATIEEGEPPAQQGLQVLADTLDEIADEYRTSDMERLPTVEEVAATLNFILSHEPETLLDGVQGSVKVAVKREVQPL